MKVRISDKHLRVRLSAGEVEKLSIGTPVEVRLDAGGDISQCYRVEPAAGENSISLARIDDMLRIRIPEDWLLDWPSSERVSMEGSVKNENGELTVVAVEKDLPCAH